MKASDYLFMQLRTYVMFELPPFDKFVYNCMQGAA